MIKLIAYKIVRFSLVAYGAMWLAIESINLFFPDLIIKGFIWFGTLLGISFGIGLWRAWPKKEIELIIQNSDSKLNIKFGDIFEQPGCICIHVNEFFDGIIGDHVSQTSIHGQFINNILNGNTELFNERIEKALINEKPIEIIPRACGGNTKKYKIGTTASIDINGKRYLLFAHAKTNLVTLKAYATFQELWDSLDGLWEAIRIRANGNPVSIPLAGSGLSGVGLPAYTLIEIIIISFSYYTKKRKISDKVTLILDTEKRKEIYLPLISDYWEKTRP